VKLAPFAADREPVSQTEREMLEELFATSCAEIEAAYERLGHQIGWRFVTGPKSGFRDGVDVALVTLNPGGDFDPPEHPHGSSEMGSAYIVESWDGLPPGRAPLQLQVRQLFAALARVLDESSGDALLGRALTAHFIPFRSPSFDRLGSRPESVEFARQLWARLLPALKPRIIVTMDTTTAAALIVILGSTLCPPASKSLPVGWGTYEADLHRFASTPSPRVLLRLPHLSRFKVFTRSQSAPYLREIFAQVREAIA
jgi:hypothetical protein